MKPELWALFDFVTAFSLIGLSFRTKEKWVSVLNWGVAGGMILMGILQLMGRLPL